MADALARFAPASPVARYLRAGLTLAVHRVDLGLVAAALAGLAIIALIIPRAFKAVLFDRGGASPAGPTQRADDASPEESRATTAV